jgi:hypothetical protein
MRALRELDFWKIEVSFAEIIYSTWLVDKTGGKKLSRLIFRTPAGAATVPAGTSKMLGVADVSPCSSIRVVAAERTGSVTGMSIRLTITEGNELVAQLDTLSLTPRSQVTQVYQVPATRLTIYADALAGTGNDAIDLLVYGSP